MVDTAKGKRSWVRPQFTIGALLLLITVCAPFLAYVASVRAWNRQRKQSYDALLAKGAVFGPRGRPNPKAKTEESVFQKTWKSITADPDLPSFDAIALRESSAGHITDKDLKSLEHFPEIEEFHCIQLRTATDEGLAALVKLPKLKTIAMVNLPKVSGEFLSEFPDGSALEGLGFARLELLDGLNLKSLSRFKNLNNLAISDCPLLTDDSLREVDLPPGVTTLLVTSVKFGDETIARWLAQVKLKRLSIEAPITRAVAPAFSQQMALEELSIQDAPLIDEDLSFLKDCHQLGRLSLTSMPVRGELLAFIPSPEEIHHLNFSNTLFSDENLSNLNRFFVLSGLDLSWTPITGEGLKTDTALPGPVMLFLEGTRFSDLGKEAFSKCKLLNTVHLPSNWSPADHQRFAESDKPIDPRFNSYFSSPPGGQTWGPPTLRQAPMENCPADLMKPVAELHAIGRAEEEEIQGRQGRGP